MKEFQFVTSNEDKFREVKALLGRDVTINRINLDLDEIQEINVEAVVEHKVKQAYQEVHKPVMVEDTGLYFAAWGGLPGALMKWFLKTIGNEGMCKLMREEENRRAWAETVFGIFDGEVFESFAGRVEGSIAQIPRGDYAFGWDPIFVPEGFDQTYGEMGMNKKNNTSSRLLAMEKLREKILIE